MPGVSQIQPAAPAEIIEDRPRNRRDVRRHHVALRPELFAQNRVRRTFLAGRGDDALRQTGLRCAVHRTIRGLFCPASVKFCHAALCRKTKEPSKSNSIRIEIIDGIPSTTKTV